ncbi:AAA family ATPase [Selenomonas montiformis]|uniref:AAA family ATPase n=1 Tax=Selenomonas montiformis TaxID=2652285 RepID=UPI003F8B0CD1
MIPVMLKMKNFLSYEDEEFDFRKITNATVVGNNGAGKSSFCTDAITWALYGRGSRGDANTNDNYVTTGAESCCVEFTFESNESLYKVVRSFNIRKAKSALNLFTINADGDEIPLSVGKTRETQKYIEKNILHMTFETFVASSMVFQNQSDEFTNGMSDMERKEALISILDVDGWSKIQKKATEDIAKLKGEIALEENNISHFEQAIAQKADQLAKKADLEKELAKLQTQKAEQNKVVEANQAKVFQLQEIDKQIESMGEQENTLSKSIASNQESLAFQQTNVNTNNASIQDYREKMGKEQKILDHKADIEKAAVEEADITAQIEKQNQNKMLILQKENELVKIKQDGLAWQNNITNQISALDINISNAEKQAEALKKVPCSTNPQLVSSCLFLSMANQAAQQLQGLYEKRQALKAQIMENPNLPKMQQVKAELESMNFDETVVKQLQVRYNEIHPYAVLKPRLDAATDTINGYLEIINTLENNIAQSKKQIESIKVQIEKQNSDLFNVKAKYNELVGSRTNIDATLKEYYLAKNELAIIENREKEIHAAIASAETILKQIEDAEKQVKDTESAIQSKREELQTVQIMQDACSKKAGVPALIVENAVPELESIANKVLENMMDGRLQIRLDTQVETKSNTVKEVLRITVLDDGYERKYETYSGAEKFVVDLALRIAMSKFLSRRAGASVQLFVLDEGVSCADEENRGEILEAIRSISGEFAKVLFVTHIEEMKDCLDGKISVTKDSSGSHIKIID